MTKKKKEKTAKNKGQWIAYVVFILTGAACGIFVPMYTGMAGQPEKGIVSDIMPFVLMLIGTYVAMLIQIVFHEAGHLIFGLMTGYRFSSFRIANLMWVKLDGRIQFRKLHIAGTGGQCLMIPPDLKDGKIPVMLYNFGGAIMNLVTAVLCVGLSFLCSTRSLGWTILMIFSVIGLAFALINGLPIKMGAVNNDGKNALDLSHSEEATQALWIQMKVNEQISYKAALGISTSKLKKQREIPNGANIPDYLNADEIERVRKAETAIMALLDVGMDYKQIKDTLLCKARRAA